MLKDIFSSGKQLDTNIVGGITNFKKTLLLQWTLHTEEILNSYDS